MWKNHTRPQQPGTCSSCWSPAWSHTVVGWYPMPQPGRLTWLCWSLWRGQHAQADPTGVQCFRSGLAIPTSQLTRVCVVVPEKPYSVGILKYTAQTQTMEIWKCHWLQNLIFISLQVGIATADGSPCLSSDGYVTSHHPTLNNAVNWLHGTPTWSCHIAHDLSRSVQINMDSCSKHQLTTVAGLVVIGGANQIKMKHLRVSTYDLGVLGAQNKSQQKQQSNQLLQMLVNKQAFQQYELFLFFILPRSKQRNGLPHTSCFTFYAQFI